MDRLEYVPKSDLSKVAEEIIDLLKQKEIPIWQAKEALSEASKLAEWQILK